MFIYSSAHVVSTLPTQEKPKAEDAEILGRDDGRPSCAHTWVQPEEAGRAAEILPGESRIFLEVINEHFIQSLRHIGPI